MVDDEYIGDGVYASFDGFYIWLATDDVVNKVVAIEPNVWRRLADYVQKIVDHEKKINDEDVHKSTYETTNKW